MFSQEAVWASSGWMQHKMWMLAENTWLIVNANSTQQCSFQSWLKVSVGWGDWAGCAAISLIDFMFTSNPEDTCSKCQGFKSKLGNNRGSQRQREQQLKGTKEFVRNYESERWRLRDSLCLNQSYDPPETMAGIQTQSTVQHTRFM